MLKLFFRADGNQNIATGHLMRCLTIARACQKYADENGLQADIRFVVSDQESVSLLKERMQCSPSGEPEFPVVCLSYDYRTPALELPVQEHWDKKGMAQMVFSFLNCMKWSSQMLLAL